MSETGEDAGREPEAVALRGIHDLHAPRAETADLEVPTRIPLEAATLERSPAGGCACRRPRELDRAVLELVAIAPEAGGEPEMTETGEAELAFQPGEPHRARPGAEGQAAPARHARGPSRVAGGRRRPWRRHGRRARRRGIALDGERPDQGKRGDEVVAAMRGELPARHLVAAVKIGRAHV